MFFFAQAFFLTKLRSQVMSGDNKTMEGGYRAFIDTISQGLKDFVKLSEFLLSLQWLTALYGVLCVLLLDQEVKSISYSKGVGVRVETKAGHVASADFALVTVSLGVLKHGGLQFQPPLPADKQTAIQNLGMGLENKVIFMFEEKDVFWPQQTHYFRLASEPFIKVGDTCAVANTPHHTSWKNSFLEGSQPFFDSLPSLRAIVFIGRHYVCCTLRRC